MIAQLSPLGALKLALAGRKQARPKTRKDIADTNRITTEKAENKENFLFVFSLPSLIIMVASSLLV